jgi:hypothetical protein
VSTSWKSGSTRAWRLLREQVLADNRRDNDGRCQIALTDTNPDGSPLCAGQADCVHHAIGRGITADAPEFVVASCTPGTLRVGRPARSSATTRVSNW